MAQLQKWEKVFSRSKNCKTTKSPSCASIRHFLYGTLHYPPQKLVAGLLWKITYFGGQKKLHSYLFVEEC